MKKTTLFHLQIFAIFLPFVLGQQDNLSNRYILLPFSIGPRTCIGNRFALMEIKSVLATLIQSFSFSLIPGMSIDGKYEVLYKPNPKVQLLVRKVKE